MYQFYVFILCFNFLLIVSCSMINERLSSVCVPNALLLFDESKGVEKLNKLKLDKIGI